MYRTPSPLLLSRVAECAYWAGRYLERTEGTARLIKSHSDLVIDLPRAATVGWAPLLSTLGLNPDATANRHVVTTEERVIEFLVADAANPASVRSSVSAAYANLRVTRAVMPLDAVEVLTELHNHVETTATAAVDRRGSQRVAHLGHPPLPDPLGDPRRDDEPR